MSLTLYTKNNCPACNILKAKLKIHGKAFQEVNVEEHIAAKEILASNGLRSVPQLFVDGKHIGNSIEALESYGA